jgi:osmoprotectant transport system permease protein
MQEQETLWHFFSEYSDKLLQQTMQHIGLTGIASLIAVLIGLPLGIIISRRPRLAQLTLGIAGILQTIPSIALLGAMIPLLGIGAKPAIVALLLYALLPIIRNTYTGITGVNPELKEAAAGMGMGRMHVLMKVELPLAMPVIIAGIRTATVINVGVATLAAYIAAGGLGEFIFGGIALNNTNMILTGAIPAALLALLFDFLLGRLQRLKFKRPRAVWLLLPLIIIACSSFYLIPATRNGRLLAGFTPEFMGRNDGYIGLKKRYKLDINTVVISDAVMYKAAYENKLDVVSGYSTDGRLKAYDLITLRDDRHIFPPYYAAPLVQEKVLQQFPELEPVLDLLSGTINDSVMTVLNYKADYLHQSPEQIAKDFLVANGLWEKSRHGRKGVVRIGSKIFAEQYILVNMYAMLIKGYTDLEVETKTGLGGTKICFDALTNNQIDMYPEYTGTGLLVVLQPDAALLNRIMVDKNAVYNFVQEQFNKQYHLKWLKPIGFNNTYALMMRKQQAEALKIASITDLKKYQDRK